MGLSSVVSAVKTAVTLASGFSALGRDANVSINDYKVLTIGSSRAAVIFHNGCDLATGSPMARSGIYITEHTILIRMYHKYKYDSTTYLAQLADTDSVITALHTDDTLGGVALDSRVTSVSTVEIAEMGDGQAFFLNQDITFVVDEELSH